MTENSVIIMGIDLEEYDDIKDYLMTNESLCDILYDKKIECLGLDGNYWAIGKILSNNENEYVKEISLDIFDIKKAEKEKFIKEIKDANNEIFKDISINDIKIYLTIQI